MATRRWTLGRWHSALALGATALTAAGAPAAPRLVAHPAGAAAVDAVSVVAAGPPASRTVWYGLRIGAGERALLVVNLPSGARVDAGGQRWLDALEEVTALRVLPPFDEAPACVGMPPDPTHTVRDSRPWPAATALRAAQVADAASAVTAAAGWGYALDVADQAYLAGGPGPTLLVEVEPPGLVLRVVGVTEDPYAGIEALTLGREVPLTLWHLGAPAPALAGVSTLEPVDLDLSWLLGRGESDYPAARDAALADGAGSLVILEASDTSRVHEGTVLPSGRPLIPSLAAAVLDGNVDCRELLLAWRSEPAVPAFCAPGALATAPGGAPCQPPPQACEGALDLLLALGRTTPEPTGVTRWVGRVGDGPAPTLDDGSVGASSEGWVRAPTLQAAGCVTPGGTGSGGHLGWGGAETGGYANHGSGAVGGYEYYPPDETPVSTVDVTCAVFDDTSCSGGEGDSCGGDSGGGEYDGDSCSGDGGGCDSGGGEYDGDTCGGGNGGGCDSGGGYDGDTCSGGSGGGGDCAVRRPRLRLRVSQVTLAAALLALVARRAGRRRPR